ncbi:hypothetical protein L1049_015781 [Liquidambar formosana]|uniref:Uncharacterized protein n=1 Tax=Liquidambar formosana TaxID=63359 RepID=A0AAP0X013_LIQFO
MPLPTPMSPSSSTSPTTLSLLSLPTTPTSSGGSTPRHLLLPPCQDRHNFGGE